MSKGVNINQPDEKGNTPFMNATYMNSLKVIKHLFKRVKNINQTNEEGKSALTNAIQRNSIDVVRFLLENGASISIKDDKGNNLAYYLLKSYRPRNFEQFKQKVAALSSKRFDFSKNQKDGNSLFHLALESNDLKLLKWVHAKGINVNTKNKNGITPLHKAVMTAKDDVIIKYLLRIGADKSIKTDFEESTYALASENELLKKNNINIEFLK